MDPISDDYSCDVASALPPPTFNADESMSSIASCIYHDNDEPSLQTDNESQLLENNIGLSDDSNDGSCCSSVPEWDINWARSDIISDDSESDSDTQDTDLADELSDWVKEGKVVNSQVDKLLHILHAYHPQLPQTCRTLLKCNVNSTSNIKAVDGGEYLHIGILAGITVFAHTFGHMESSVVMYQVNIDGLPLFKSASTQLWPILGCLVNHKTPFLIGCFCGKSKPSDVTEFMNDFVQEAITLANTGFDLDGRHFTAKISCFICDTPARGFIKQTKSHTAYFGCERCDQKGKYIKGRMTFPATDANKRTDSEFRAETCAAYHQGTSPVLKLNVDLVSDFVLDYMHLVCLGVVRRLLIFWMRGPLPVRMTATSIRLISELLCSLQASIPMEFARKPRSLNEIDRWKASEFRQFLIYTGPVVMKNYLDEEHYRNFQCLSVAIYLLLSPKFCKYYCQFAEKLLIYFVAHASDLYGEEFTVFNVHSLIHLADDVRRFGQLDSISCFPFENFLGKMKKSVRKPQLLLQQIANRLSEGYFRPANNTTDSASVEVTKEHSSGPILVGLLGYKQYRMVSFSGFTLKTTNGDSYVMCNNNSIGLLRNIVADGKSVLLIVQRFRSMMLAFEKPLNSTDIGIYTVSNLSDNFEVWDVAAVDCKYVLMPLARGETWIAVPLLHTL